MPQEDFMMERARVVKDEVADQNIHFLSVFVETDNSCLVLLSEREDKLGTLAIAVPGPKSLLGSPTSSILMGDRNQITARIFAEQIATKKGKISLVSIYLETTDELKARSAFARLVEKITSMETRNTGVLA